MELVSHTEQVYGEIQRIGENIWIELCFIVTDCHI